jgi:hypothetical protein
MGWIGRASGFSRTMPGHILPFLLSNGFNVRVSDLKSILGWPPQNPDLNPIEHVWNQLKRRMNAYPARATTITELEARIHQEWYKFTKEDCLKFIDSMSNRIKVVIRSKGGPTRY